MTQTPPISAEFAKLKLWFFRDLNEEQRLSLFRLHGFPVEEMQQQSVQIMALGRMFNALTAAASIPASRGVGTEGIWPAKLTLRDTKVFADEGQRIFTTATGYGYEKREYARVDVASPTPQPVQEQEPVAWLNPDNGAIAKQATRNNTVPLYASPPEQEKYDAVVAGFDRLAATQNEIVHQITSRAEAAEAKVERLTEAAQAVFAANQDYLDNFNGAEPDQDPLTAAIYDLRGIVMMITKP